MTNGERSQLTVLIEALILEVVSLQSVLVQDQASNDWEFRKATILSDLKVRSAVRQRFQAVYAGITAQLDDAQFLKLLTTMRVQGGAQEKQA